jgi:hypothetical protein
LKKNIRTPMRVPKSKKARRELYTEALVNSYSSWCDVLDCSKSFARRCTTRSFKEILEEALSLPKAFWTIIHRAPVGGQEEHYEFGVSTMATPDYFIFMDVRPDVAERILARYGLGEVRPGESFRR